MQDYGAALRKLRKHFNYTQIALARKLNVSYQAVSKWENNANRMDLDIIRAVCDVFGITPDEFIRIADGADVTEIINGKEMQAEGAQAPRYGEQGGESAMPCEPSAGTDCDRDGTAPPQETTEQSERSDPSPVPNAPQAASSADFISKRFIVIISAVAAALLTFIIVMCAVFIPKRRSGGFSSILSNLTPSERTVTITLYDGQNNEFWSYTCNIGDTIIEPITYKEGYEFKGWYTDIAFKHEASFPTVAQSDVTLYGKWSKKSITVEFLSGIGDGYMSPISVEYGKKTTLPRSMFTCGGEPMLYWIAEDINDGMYMLRIADGATVDLSAYGLDTVKLTASYGANDAGLVIFEIDANGGKTDTDGRAALGYGCLVLDDLGCYRPGYTLVGWKAGDRTYKPGEKFDVGPIIFHSYAIKALWEKGGGYIVHYACGKEDHNHSETIVYGSAEQCKLQLPSFADPAHIGEGYKAIGFTRENDDSVYHIGDGIVESPDIYEYYYSVSIEPIKCDTTIEVETDDGVKTYDDIYTWSYGDHIGAAVYNLYYNDMIQVKSGYLIKDFTVYVNEKLYGGELQTVTADETAKLRVVVNIIGKPYSVVFPNGDLPELNLRYDERFEMPAPNSRVGYIFGGWTISDMHYDAGKTYVNIVDINETDRVYAYSVWTPIEYIVEYSASGCDGTPPAAVTVKYDQAIVLADADITHSGRALLGWEWQDGKAKRGAELRNLTHTDGATVTVYAVWETPYAGDGTELSPYIVDTYEKLSDLCLFTEIGENKFAHYRLGCDIDCAGRSLYAVNSFSGVFDGDYHTIKNARFKYNHNGSIGLFCFVAGATVCDLGIDEYSIEKSTQNNEGVYVSPLIAAVYQSQNKSTTISRVRTCGKICIAGYDNYIPSGIGGLVGYVQGGGLTVEDCFATGTIECDLQGYHIYIGGLIGSIDIKSEITRCYADMRIRLTRKTEQNNYGNIYVGGFLGEGSPDPVVRDSFVAGSIVSDVEITDVDAKVDCNAIGQYVRWVSVHTGKPVADMKNTYVADDYYATAAGKPHDVTENCPFTARGNLTDRAFLTDTLGWDMTDVWQTDGVSLPTLKGFSA